MKQRTIETTAFDTESLPKLGNRFFIGNGYLGVRGTLEEYGKEALAAVNLAGIYDRYGDGWREPLNAPNPFWLQVYADGALTALPSMVPAEHTQRLDISTGIHSRTTRFQNGVTLHTERFAHMDKPHLLCLKARVETSRAANIRLISGIDADVWDIHGPHYSGMTLDEGNGVLYALGKTNENDTVAVCALPSLSLPCQQTDENKKSKNAAAFCFALSPGEAAELTVIACIYTSKDVPNPLWSATNGIRRRAYDTLKAESTACWRELWDDTRVRIEGDEDAELALNYSLYQLLCAAPRHTDSLSVPARGLSGQTYKGAVFWDTELFMLDFYLAALPKAAKSILRLPHRYAARRQGEGGAIWLSGRFLRMGKSGRRIRRVLGL